MSDDAEGTMVELLNRRRIRAMRAVPVPGFHGVCLSVSVFDLERFLDIVVPPSESKRAEGLLPRIIGRPQDLTASDEPWTFEIVPGHSGTGFEFHALVGIPDADVEAVLSRLSDDPVDRLDGPP